MVTLFVLTDRVRVCVVLGNFPSRYPISFGVFSCEPTFRLHGTVAGRVRVGTLVPDAPSGSETLLR